MAITLRKLEIFIQVADLGQVTKAGQSLSMSQSAVSMALAELESTAGGSLFLRQGRRLLLNDRGRLLLEPAREILRKTAQFERLLSDSGEAPRGLLRIGASTTIGNYLLPEYIAEFSRHYPEARATLQVGNTQQIEQSLARGEIDLGLIEGPSHAPQLEILPWRDDELIVIAGREHPLRREPAVTLAMLAAADWIMREPGSGTREVFEAALADRSGQVHIALELGHTEAVKKAVEAGMGIACLSRLAVQRELDHGWLVEIQTALDLKRPLVILLPRGASRTRLLQAFLERLDG